MGKCRFTKAIVVGRLGSDPVEIGQTGVMFPVLSTAVENGNETINIHKIYAFGEQRQLCMKYLKRGDLCCVEGRRDISQVSKVVCEHITFLSSNKKANI